MKRILILALAMIALSCALIVMLVSCTDTPAGSTESASSAVETVSEESTNPFGSFSPTSKGDDISVDAGEISKIAPPEPYDPESTC